jgi:hypothetical protein
MVGGTITTAGTAAGADGQMSVVTTGTAGGTTIVLTDEIETSIRVAFAARHDP